MLNEKKLSRLLAGLLVFSFVLTNNFVSARADELEVVTETSVEDSSAEETVVEEGALFSGMQSVVEADKLVITYTLNSIWESGYSLGVDVKNVSNDVVSEWALTLPITNEIASIWSVELTSQDENGIVVKYPAWSTDIFPGQSVNFGMNCNGSLVAMPASGSLIGGYDVNVEGVSSNVTIAQEWDGGFNALLEVTNYDETLVNDWQIEFDYENEINSFWGGIIETKEDNHYVVRPYDTSQAFNNGETLSFGFQVLNGNKELSIDNVTISLHVCEEKKVVENPIGDWEEGEGYLKETTEDNVEYNEETDERYVRNQLLLGVMLGIDEETVKALVETFDAKVVGYIPLSEMYQIEFNEYKTYDGWTN